MRDKKLLNKFTSVHRLAIFFSVVHVPSAFRSRGLKVVVRLTVEYFSESFNFLLTEKNVSTIDARFRKKFWLREVTRGGHKGIFARKEIVFAGVNELARVRDFIQNSISREIEYAGSWKLSRPLMACRFHAISRRERRTKRFAIR